MSAASSARTSGTAWPVRAAGGTGTPYAGLAQSGMGYRAMRYGWRWEVGERFSLDLKGARQEGFGGFAQPVLGDAAEQLGGAQHSVQVRGGVSF